MNPTLKKIQDSILNTPELRYPNNSARGYIAAVYYDSRRCDVVYWAPDGTKITRRHLDLPKDGDGVFHPSLKPGDIVEISFKGKTKEGLYISGVQKKNKHKRDFDTEKGQELPLSTNLF